MVIFTVRQYTFFGIWKYYDSNFLRLVAVYVNETALEMAKCQDSLRPSHHRLTLVEERWNF